MGPELEVQTLKLRFTPLPFRLHLRPRRAGAGGKREAEDMGGILGVVRERLSMKGNRVKPLAMELESSNPEKLVMMLVVLGAKYEQQPVRAGDRLQIGLRTLSFSKKNEDS